MNQQKFYPQQTNLFNKIWHRLPYCWSYTLYSLSEIEPYQKKERVYYILLGSWKLDLFSVRLY